MVFKFYSIFRVLVKMTTNQDIRIRVSTEQKKQLFSLAESNGFSNLSAYVRVKIFENDTHSKLNHILELLKKAEVK